MARPASLLRPAGGARAANISYLGARRCQQKFELYYPDGFLDESYLLTERWVKERAHVDWTRELGARTFGQLLARGEYREIASRALRVEGRTNLLFSFEKMALRQALRPLSGARLFAHELHAFLHGRGSLQRRFTDWAQAVSELPCGHARVATWPVVTVFGFLARPDCHLLVKPQAMRRAARAYGFEFSYEATPGWRTYDSALTFAAIIRRDLERLAAMRARDMIDLQSFIWVQGAGEYDAG